jgi:pimeloyl-ACP methyl ester carboxylesterase
VSHRERVVSAGDAELLLREWGTDGPPIFFWHALGDHTSLQMVEAGPILAEGYGFRVLGVDAPGFGGSPRVHDSGYQMGALVELAASLLEALDLDRIVWSGSSWGGILGVHFAAAHPEKLAALALVDGGYLDPLHEYGETLDEARAFWRGQKRWRFRSWDEVIAEAREAFQRWSPGLDEYVRSAYREENGEVVSTVGPDVYAAAMHGIDRSPPSQVHAQLAETGLPILLLGATEPPKENVRRSEWRERFSRTVPHAEVRVLQGAPHLMLEARPEETARAIGEWLRDLPIG